MIYGICRVLNLTLLVLWPHDQFMVLGSIGVCVCVCEGASLDIYQTTNNRPCMIDILMIYTLQ